MNVAEAGLEFRIGSDRRSYCVLHFKATDGHDVLDDDDLTEIAVGIANWWGDPQREGATEVNSMNWVYPSEVQLHHITVKRIQPTESEPIVFFPEFAVGTYSATKFEAKWGAVGFEFETQAWMHPPQCAWLVTLHTDVIGSRSARGRLFLPAVNIWLSASFPFGGDNFPDVDELCNGIVDDTIIDWVRDPVSNLRAEVALRGDGLGEFVWCVYSKKLNQSWVVSHLSLSKYLRTQRERAADDSWWYDFEHNSVGFTAIDRRAPAP